MFGVKWSSTLFLGNSFWLILGTGIPNCPSRVGIYVDLDSILKYCLLYGSDSVPALLHDVGHVFAW